jgi:hypothetical protein
MMKLIILDFFDERSDLRRLLMQSYGEFRLIQRNQAISLLTCVDKRPIFGQIGGNGKKVVQRFVFSIFIRIFAGDI